MKMAGTAVFSVFFGLIIGCSNTPINSAVINSSNPQKITITSRDKPGFQARSTTYEFFSLLGEIPVYHEGKRIVSENGIENPADYIGQEIAKKLSDQFNISSIETSEKKMISWEVEDIVSHYPEGGLIVDVQTLNWGFRYNSEGNPFALEYKYRVFYDAKLRIMDSESKRKVAEGYCKIIPKDDDHLFSREQLFENSAQVLKFELKWAADDCLRQFSEDVINPEIR